MIREAVRRGIATPVTRTQRLEFAAHLLQGAADVRTVRELLFLLFSGR